MRIYSSVLLVLIIFSTGANAVGSIHYFDLKNRSANEVIPILQPLLLENEAVSGDGFQLFIKTSNARAQEIEKLIESIDRVAKMFRISVTNDEHIALSQNSIDGSVRVKTGDADIRVGNDRYIDEGVSVNVDARTIDDQSNRTQFINVQAGKPAFISREKVRLVPVHTYVKHPHGVAVIDHGRTPYSSEDGFYVEARSADKIYAHISIQTVSGRNERYERYDHEQQTAETALRIRLGQWFEIGGNTNSYNRSEKGILFRTKEREQRYSKIFLKVELIN